MCAARVWTLYLYLYLYVCLILSVCLYVGICSNRSGHITPWTFGLILKNQVSKTLVLKIKAKALQVLQTSKLVLKAIGFTVNYHRCLNKITPHKKSMFSISFHFIVYDSGLVIPNQGGGYGTQVPVPTIRPSATDAPRSTLFPPGPVLPGSEFNAVILVVVTVGTIRQLPMRHSMLHLLVHFSSLLD